MTMQLTVQLILHSEIVHNYRWINSSFIWRQLFDLLLSGIMTDPIVAFFRFYL